MRANNEFSGHVRRIFGGGGRGLCQGGGNRTSSGRGLFCNRMDQQQWGKEVNADVVGSLQEEADILKNKLDSVNRRIAELENDELTKTLDI
jgi:hypothetical protein